MFFDFISVRFLNLKVSFFNDVRFRFCFLNRLFMMLLYNDVAIIRSMMSLISFFNRCLIGST